MTDDPQSTESDPRGEALQRAALIAAAPLATLAPNDFDAATPCTDYDVAALVNHLVFAFELTRTSAERQSWDEELTAETLAPSLRDHPHADWPRLGAAEAERAGRSWLDPATWSGETTMGTTPMPAEMVGSMMISEFLGHGWDLAKAIGQPFDPPEDLAQAGYDAAAGIAQMGRDGGWFGAEVEVPADAPAMHRLLGITGRDLSWTP